MFLIDPGHPLFAHFRGLVADAVGATVRSPGEDDTVDYLAGLLVAFSRTDGVFAIRDAEGRRLTSVYEMLAEGDVRLNADSFDREREVHKHIGDYILFWSGINPDFLRRLRLDDGRDLVCDYTVQGRASYHVVSTFEHPPYSSEAPTFRKLSDGFDGFTAALSEVRRHLPFWAA